MKKNNTQFSLIELAEYNIPSISEDYGKDWVTYGDDNLYPQYLIELYTGSSIHSAIVKGVSAMIYGEGLDATDKDENTQKLESWLKLQTLLSNSPDCLKRLSFDLKLHGQCYVNVIWNKTRTKVAQIKHIPSQYIRVGKCDHYGEIKHYYFSNDWSNIRKKEFKPYVIPAFNVKDRTQASQLLCIKDYSPNSIFYSTPDYQGSTSYIQLDLEIAQFHLSNIKSGLFPSAMLNFNNGIPTAEERKIVERKVYSKFGGSHTAGKLLITFNDGVDTKPELTPITTNNADEQYQFLSQETTKKILTGHRITSPLLFGVKGDGQGFGNNAEELRDSYSLFSSSVIAPFQNTILKGLQHIFDVNEIHLDLYFKTLKPADFLDLDVINELEDEQQQKEGVEVSAKKQELKTLQDIDTKPTKGMIEEAIKGLNWRKEHGRGGTQIAVARARNIKNGDNLSIETIKRMNSFFARHESDKTGEGFEIGEEGFPSAGRIAWALWGGDAGQSWARKKVKEIEAVETNLSDDDFDSILDSLQGEQITGEWELVDEREHNEKNDSIENWANSLIESTENFEKKTIDSKKSGFSYLDKSFYKVRYRYAEKYSSNKSRTFCKLMMKRSNNGVVYRIEDIDKASVNGVNKSFGHKKEPYDLFRYKGGPYCGHFWTEVLYRLKDKTLKKDIRNYNEVETIPSSYKPKPRGWQDSKKAPKDMDRGGRYPK